MSKKTLSSASTVGSAVHPGQHVRDVALVPKKVTVTDAAKLLGVSRPGVSNFLNGKVATTPDMAARVERAFGIPAQHLLDMQAAYDAALAKSKGAPSNSKVYVPPFLALKANDIEAWATPHISARVRLSVLLRTLVQSTGVGLRKVDFPGNDDAMRPGWDGEIDADEGTPWIPKGRSGWEFGVDKNIKGKADSDFAKSVTATDKADRDQMTFVFVTPRRWPGKAAWVAAAMATGQWKDVRAFDASDLEQWLEQSIPGQAWFANETRQPSDGVRSLDQCWVDFADVAVPALSPVLFNPAIEAAKRTMASRLKKAPDAPTVIAADSVEEALAFLAQLFGHDGEEGLVKFHDRVLVFDKPGVLPRLARGKPGFIAVTGNREVEREFGPLSTAMHTIVVYPRNAANADPHLVLEPLNYEAFRLGLEDMGLDRDDVSKYSNESGRSLTVLRRRLSTVPAVKTPLWASDPAKAASLIPFVFVGAWSARTEADQLALSLLSGVEYEVLEKESQRLAALNDPPVWSIGTHRGVISKIDALYAVAGMVTFNDLQRFFAMAKMVLGEDDPSLDLPEDQRWAASLHGKSREFSSVLRDGISETLVLLAVHGNHLFRARLGFDCEVEAARLVRELLTPLTTRSFEANERDLPTYAEAVPGEFLSILEKDLKSGDASAAIGLMRPADTGVFGNCPRTGLLWALEGLSWNPDTFGRAVLVLAKLAEVEIVDNWGNKPINSLLSIFRAWMPQTAANRDQRLAALKLLAERHPTVAWKICIEQIDAGSKTGDYSHKPRWRPDGYGFGEPFSTWTPIIAFRNEMVDMVLGWKPHTSEMFGDLIQHLHDLSDEQQSKVWGLIKSWAATASDADKAVVRERIRVSVMSRRAARRAKKADFASLSAAAKAAYAALEPSDLLQKYEWLFRNVWVEESADELHDDEMDFRKRESRIAALRADALKEVLAAQGVGGVIRLAEMGQAASQIGWSMATAVLDEDALVDFVLEALPSAADGAGLARKNLVYGAMRSLQDEGKQDRVLRKIKKRVPADDFARVLLLAPFRRSVWLFVDKLGEANRTAYWERIIPDMIHDAAEENNEAVERLLTAGRPRAAFACVRYQVEAIKPELLHRLLSDMLRDNKDEDGQYQLEQYYIEKAFSLLDKASEVTLEEKARLEYAYIDVLSPLGGRRRESYGIPNLEKYLEANPALFVQAIVWTYKRKGGGEDPPEWRPAGADVQHMAERGHKLLESLERIPGHDEFGVLQPDRLANWVKTVREGSAELSRSKIADVCLGKLFARAPEGKDGIWPCEPVRQVMEDVQTEALSEGAHTGLYNSRGVHWRGEGGEQERELAEKYRNNERALRYSHPFVSSVHRGMAETYENEATYQDTEAGIRRRLR